MQTQDNPNDEGGHQAARRRCDPNAQEHLNKFEKKLKSAYVDLKLEPRAKSAQDAFDEYARLKDDPQLDDPLAKDDLHQTMQYYTQAMINRLRSQGSAVAYNAAAGMYAKWMESIPAYAYDSENIQMMLDENAEWLLDVGANFDEHIMSAKALEATFAIMGALSDKRVAEREELRERLKAPVLITRKRNQINERLDALAEADTRAARFVLKTADFIKELPNTTENGLDESKCDHDYDQVHERSTTQVMHYAYSYSRKAGTLYYSALDLLKEFSPQEDLPKFIRDVQPDLAVAQADKYIQCTLTDHVTNRAIKEWSAAPEPKTAIDSLRYTINILKDAVPDMIGEVINLTYGDVGAVFVDKGETAATMALYDVMKEACGEDNEANTGIREAFVKRNLYQMMALGDYTEAGVLMNHVHVKSGLPQNSALVLLSANGQEIVAASVPLVTKNKVTSRASLIYKNKKDQPPELAQIVYQRKKVDEYITWNAKEHDLEIKNHYAQQARLLSDKVQAEGLNVPHSDLSSHWIAAEYKIA